MIFTKITPEEAKRVVDNRNGIVKIPSGRIVKSINLNNQTCFAELYYSGCTYDIENIEFLCWKPNDN